MANSIAVEASNIGVTTHPQKTIIDEAGTVYNIQFRGSLTSVRVKLPEGITASAHARLAEGDIYNKGFGERLAISRAIARALTKYAKWLATKGYPAN